MSVRLVFPVLLVAFVAFVALVTIGACAPEPAAPPPPQAETLPPATSPPPGPPKKTAAEHHRDFMAGCAQRAMNSPDYCECAWAEFRKEFTDDDMDGHELDHAKVERVKGQVLAACAALVPEETVRADYTKACLGSKNELKPYCDCMWTELRKRFSPAELSDESTIAGERFQSSRAVVTKTCGNKMPESFSKEAFLKTCVKDPGDEKYCGCAWKELRKQATPGEIEAGTFDQKTLFGQFEQKCGRLRTPKTAP